MAQSSSSHRTVSWGIVGTGHMAALFAEALKQAPGARLAAVASRSAERAGVLAAQVGATHAFGDFEAMLALPDLDVVYIATPNHLHREQCLAAIAAGKAVLCEKPLGLSADEAREIGQAARAAGVFCMEGMWTHFIPAVSEAFRLIESGVIGKPLMVTGSFGVPTHFDPKSRMFDPSLGGGALLDRGCYPISLAVRLFGEASRVEGTIARSETGVDETAAATIRFAGGGMGQIEASLTASLANELHVGGTEGHIALHNPITRPTRLSLSKAAMIGGPGSSGSRSGVKQKLKAFAQDSRLLSGLIGILRPGQRVYPLGGSGYVHEINEVHKRLAAGEIESPTVPNVLSVRTLAVIDALRAGGPDVRSPPA